MYMALTHTHTHARLCRTRETQKLGEDKASGRWCWMAVQRKEEKPGHLQEARFDQLPGWGGVGWGWAIWGRGERGKTTCKSKSEVQPPLQKHESLYPSKLMKHKEAFLGFCENT